MGNIVGGRKTPQMGPYLPNKIVHAPNILCGMILGDGPLDGGGDVVLLEP